MIRQTLTLGLAAAALAGTGAAQSLEMNSDKVMMYNVSTGDLEAIVRDLGHDVIMRNNETRVVQGETEEGLRYQLAGTACDDDTDTCLGINASVTYDPGSGLDYQRINTSNVAYAATSTWAGEDYIGISRYLILDDGVTAANIRANIITLLAIAPKAYEKTQPSQPVVSSGEIAYGDDTGSYANDGTCDDARFSADGTQWDYKRNHVLHDATDCRAAVASGTVSLLLDFGDDSGDYAFDETCDDVRFSGSGRSILETNSHIKRDATDCIAAYRAGTITPD